VLDYPQQLGYEVGGDLDATCAAAAVMWITDFMQSDNRRA